MIKKLGKKKLAIIISAAVFAVIAVTLAIVLPLTLKKENEQPVSQTAQSFVNLVMRIKTPITLDSGAEIDAGYVLYNHMPDSDKENTDVKDKKAVLDGYKSEYDVLKAAKDEEDLLARQALLIASFESAVQALPSKLSSADRESIDAALELYGQLSEQSKKEASVQYAYSRLVQANQTVSELEESERLAEIAAAAKEFIDGVEAIGEVTLKSANDIEDLLYDYENLSQEVKEYTGVPEAKQRLDEALAEYIGLKDDDDVKNLKAAAAELSPVETAVTLDSKKTIESAEFLYEEMTEKAKAAEGVAEAYEIIVAARAKYDELYAIAEAERVEKFIEAANAVRTDIENVAIDWFDMLDAAGNAYRSLDYDSQSLPEVIEAFNRWDAAQTAFDRLGFQQLPMNDPKILFSGDYPPHIVLQMEENMLNPIREFYGKTSSGELDSLVNVWLNVYVDGEYQGKGQLNFSDLGHIVVNSKIVDVLKGLSAENDKIVSGANYSFSIHFEDKNGEYIPSKKTATSASKVYMW